MTTGFTIDDVRDTLTNDVTRFLGRIEASAREICERRDLGFDTVPRVVPLFQQMGDHGHAIHGTTCLVSADSLASSAELVERLALLGRDDLARAARHLERARAIAETLAGGAGDMLAMLSLELDDRSDEANKIAASWRMRAEDTLAAAATAHSAALAAPPPPRPPALPPIPAPATTPAPAPTPAPAKAPPKFDSEGWGFDEVPSAGVDDGFSFASVAEVPAPAAAAAPAAVYSFAGSVDESSIDVNTGAIDVELALIFEEEARETLDALAAQLAELGAHPANRNLCRDLERSYHTLKGAAATVGLVAISEKAAELQHRVEAIYESAEPASPALLADLVRDTVALRRDAGLESPVASEPLAVVTRDAAPPIDQDIELEFERESQALLEQANDLLAKLADESHAGAKEELAAALAKVFHRLKGSAFVVGAVPLAHHVEQLERTCESFGSAADAAALAMGLAKCAEMIKEAQRGSRSGSSLHETRAVFAGEARAIMTEATPLVAGLRDRTPAPEQRDQLRRLAHRLKGSAMVVGEERIAREATALHEVLAADGDSLDVAAVEAHLARLTELVGDGPSRPRSDERARISVPVPDAELEAGFQQECAELLDTLDRNAVALERSQRPKDDLAGLLGSYHTLKGAVNAIGLRPTGDLVHRIEDFIEALRRLAIVPPIRNIVAVLLQLNADIRRNLRTLGDGYVEVAAVRWDERLQRVLAGESRATALPTSEPVSRLGDGSEASGPSRSSGPSGPSGTTGTVDHTDRKHIRVSIDRLDALMNLAGELVINRSRVLSRLDGLQLQQTDLGRASRRVTDMVERFRDDHEFSMVPRTARIAARGGHWGSFSELELDRYEDVNILARTLAESSTDMQDMFSQLGSGLSGLADDADALGTIIAGIQSEITRARMVPLGSLFSRLQLPIRDAAQREQREVRIVTEGEDVHLDKTIADALLQPMLHLVRNAVSHGLEAPGRRTAVGKPAAGTIRLRARQELGQIAVEVFDDGGGLDLVKLHARGVAMGLIAASVPVDDPKVKDLVFVAGVTTSPTAGTISGRGVGCDVVRRAVERLNGSIRVDTQAGRSTTFSITLPLTLAISRALLLRQGDQTFAVPLNFTERILDLRGAEVIESAGRRRIELDDGFVSVRPLDEFLGGTQPTSLDGPIVILRVGDQRLVVQVDAVAGQEEVVVKNLGALLTGHPMFAGVTIRGTGEIVLILDVPSIVENALATREVRAVQSVEPAPGLPVHGVREPGDVGKLRVLFVDDSVSVRKVAERALASLGVAVTLAVDGVDALEKLHAQPFDIVFTDLEMPRMHGYELIRELRFLPAFRTLPVIVVTSRSGKKHREEAQALGATHYMTKPFSPQSLEAALSKFGGPRAAALASPSGDSIASEGAS